MRMEHDLLGEKAVPASAYYGIQTARAMENFQISGRTLSDYPELIIGFAHTKMAAAKGNTDVGKMDKKVRDAIIKAGMPSSPASTMSSFRSIPTRAAPAPLPI